MCYNCGCHIPDDPMGDDRNITDQTFEKLAKKKGKTTEEVKGWVLEMLEKGKITDPDVKEMFHQASHAWGQPIPEAERYTKELLKDALKIK